MNIEYPFTIGDFKLRPELQIRRTYFTTPAYKRPVSWWLFSGIIRAEYTWERLKIIGAVRVDKYHGPGDLLIPVQVGASYQIHDNHFLRAVYSRATQGPSFIDTYMRLDLGLSNAAIDSFEFIIDEDRDLRLVDSVEVGYRASFLDFINVDCELFASFMKDVAAGQFSVNPSSEFAARYSNTRVTARQLGATLSVTALFNPVDVRVYGTIQHSKIFNTVDNFLINGIIGEPEKDATNEATPLFFGGLNINWRLMDSLHANLNAYFYTSQVYYNSFRRSGMPVDAKPLVNLTVGYNITDQVKMIFNWRNALMQDQREYPHADEIHSTILLGIDVDVSGQQG